MRFGFLKKMTTFYFRSMWELLHLFIKKLLRPLYKMNFDLMIAK
ncbi:Uncharacterized protein GNX_0458 [Leptospira interrogans serovar Canicola]|nr:Uncharacterized protein GNX_0458 [Leptospira interrogans serovar Canicola]